MNKATYHSKVRVYTNGLVDDSVGAYAYIVLENVDCGPVKLGEGSGRLFAPSLLKAKFAQAGKADSEVRMKMRAVYEGLRHCPDGSEVEVYTDHFLMPHFFETVKADEADGDIAERYRRYVAEHRIVPTFCATKYYNGRDYPDNDHDEWTWWAHNLCEDAIKKFNKGKQ